MNQIWGLEGKVQTRNQKGLEDYEPWNRCEDWKDGKMHEHERIEKPKQRPIIKNKNQVHNTKTGQCNSSQESRKRCKNGKELWGLEWEYENQKWNKIKNQKPGKHED